MKTAKIKIRDEVNMKIQGLELDACKATDFSNLIKNYTDNIVTLESIVNGTVLEQLTQFQVRTNHLYTKWLVLQNGRFLV